MCFGWMGIELKLMGKLIAMPAGQICASVRVHAAKKNKFKEQLILSPLQSKYVEEQPGNLQMGFASIHTTTGCYVGWCKDVYVFEKYGIMETVQFGKDACLSEDSTMRFSSGNCHDYSFRIGRLGFSKKRF